MEDQQGLRARGDGILYKVALLSKSIDQIPEILIVSFQIKISIIL